MLELGSALGKGFVEFSEWNLRLGCLFVVDFSIDQRYNFGLDDRIGEMREGFEGLEGEL